MLETARMRSVQTPIIPVIGRLIAETPGTISLGQGIVSYGPPPEAIDTIGAFAGDVENHPDLPAGDLAGRVMGALRRGASYCRGFLEGLARVRALVLEQFAALHGLCAVPRPDGAFYCLVRVHTAMDAMTLAARLVREHRVAVIPGTAFGLTDGCYLRVSYGALEASTVAEGMSRLVRGVTEIVR